MTLILTLLLGMPSALASEPASPEALIAEARRRARAGDTQGVRIVASEALEHPGDHQRTAQYLVALSLDLEDRFGEALELYDALVAAYPRRQVPADLAVRRAVCLGELGRPRDALHQLGAVGPTRTLAPSDQVKVQVLRASWDLEAGRERRGLRRLDEVLSAAGPGDAPWWQAQARLQLLERALTQADTLPLDGGVASPSLERRAALLALAQEQLVELIRLDQPRFGLLGFLALTRSYDALGRELLDAGGPSVARPQVEGIWVKGAMLADRGEQLAARKGWTTDPAPELRQARVDLVQAIEALP